jgi:hypothetical protein
MITTYSRPTASYVGIHDRSGLGSADNLYAQSYMGLLRPATGLSCLGSMSWTDMLRPPLLATMKPHVASRTDRDRCCMRMLYRLVEDTQCQHGMIYCDGVKMRRCKVAMLASHEACLTPMRPCTPLSPVGCIAGLSLLMCIRDQRIWIWHSARGIPVFLAISSSSYRPLIVLSFVRRVASCTAPLTRTMRLLQIQQALSLASGVSAFAIRDCMLILLLPYLPMSAKY